MKIQLLKEQIRDTMRERLKVQSERDRSVKSKSIAGQILKTEEFQKAKLIMFYYATDREVETRELIKEAMKKGKKTALPYIDQKTKEIVPSIVHDLKHDLVVGSYDIMEPKPEKREPFSMSEIDLILVPGLAFDRKKQRLGRGKGYYDRFLKKLPTSIKRIGLAFDFQMLEEIPATEFDEPLDLIVTND